MKHLGCEVKWNLDNIKNEQSALDNFLTFIESMDLHAIGYGEGTNQQLFIFAEGCSLTESDRKDIIKYLSKKSFINFSVSSLKDFD